ncbi:dihydrofolate reductase family protein [Roseiterribacter gracilis]|uniref:Dihydrofolate reductase n=1 Tax=Roseiterribacter gracilis TaxID=2812848 RepID=A0A8S8XJ65_9PROT|nr:dihydrofolate reductase [Rhodospirillales bacterium TMPK1]
MRRLILKLSMSVDGFVGGPNGEMDAFMRHRSPDGAAWVTDLLRDSGVQVIGRKTYEGWATFWPTAPGPMTEAMNALPRIVVTRQASVDTSLWDAEVANGDLATEIARLKQQDGKDILAHGGAGFAQSLIKLGLVDEYRLVVHPVALGAGLPLFPALMDLQLVSATSFASGTVAKVYRPA